MARKEPSSPGAGRAPARSKAEPDSRRTHNPSARQRAKRPVRQESQPVLFLAGRSRIGAKQLADHDVGGYREACVSEEFLDYGFAEEVHRATGHTEPQFAHRHAPGPETRPCGKEPVTSQLADDGQA